MKPKIWILAAAFLASTIVFLLTTEEFTYHRLFICGLCAKIRRSHLRQVPLSDLTLWTLRDPVDHTPLSRFLEEAGLINGHPHIWQSVRGSGNGVQCGIGNANEIFRLANQDIVVDFFRELHDREGSQAAIAWITLFLSPLTSDQAREVLYQRERWKDHEWLEAERKKFPR